MHSPIDAPFELPGFSVGHWTHPSGATGCTVVVPDERALAVADVRGGAPGTREVALLDQGRLVQRVDAVLLTGGSAFGLAAADGVARWLRERRRGFPTESGPVPIVPAAVLFDLVGPDPLWPTPDAGYWAAEHATADGWRCGRVGAGSGARVGKARGRQHSSAAGIGAARVNLASGSLAAIVAVNAFGDVVDPEGGRIVAGTRADAGSNEDSTRWEDSEALILAEGSRHVDAEPGTNTTIAVVAVDTALDRDALVRIAVAAHDGFARAIRPAHTLVDGDTVFVLARREGHADVRATLQLATAAQVAVATAIVRAATATPEP